MNFSVSYDHQPLRFLRKLPKEIASRIVDKMDTLDNPIPSDARTVVSAKGVYRLRIGDYRILYRVDYKDRTLVAFKIDKRSRVYR